MTLSNLITRLEGMTGPDREVDALIFKAIGAPLPQKFLNRGISLEWKEDERCFVMPIDGMRIRYEQPAFTSSLDAAMSLVPEGFAIRDWMIWPGHPSELVLLETRLHKGEYWYSSSDGRWTAKAATPVISVCCVALKAIASLRAIQEPAQ